MTSRVLILTYSPTPWDSRVKRKIATLAAAGKDVILVSPDTACQIDGVSTHHPIVGWAQTKRAFLLNLIIMMVASLLPGLARTFHRRRKIHRQSVACILAARPEIIHANDWMTLPAAVDAAKTIGAAVIYDSHEIATHEHADRLWWRLTAMRYVVAIEGQMIDQVDRIITVSEGLRAFLKARYAISPSKISVVRNLPDKQLPEAAVQKEPRPIGQNIVLAYSGLIRPERHIETMLLAMAQLPQHYRLVITGFGSAPYLETLQETALQLGLGERVLWQPAVKPEEVVKNLVPYDIGLYLSSGKTLQQRLALPNKIFEYTAAGLAIVSAGSDDVDALLRQYGHGVVLKDDQLSSLVEAIRAIDLTHLQAMKAKARQAAENLNWSQEKLLLLALYSDITRGV